MQQAFSVKYKSFSDGQLLAVISHREDYTPEAIEAAEQELRERNISPEMITDSEPALVKPGENGLKESRFSPLYEKLHQLVHRLYFGHGLNTTERMVNAISLWLVIIAIASTIDAVSRVSMMVRLLPPEDEYLIFLVLGSPVLTAVLAYYFRKRKTGAWVVLAVCIYIYITVEALTWYFYLDNDGEMFRQFFRKDLSDLLALGLNITVLYQMNKLRMRALFRINSNWQILSLCIAIFILVVLNLCSF